MYVSVHMHACTWVCLCVLVYKWRSEDNLPEWIFYFSGIELRFSGLVLSAFACWTISLAWFLTSSYYCMFPFSICRLPIGCGSWERTCEVSQQRSERLSSQIYLYTLDGNVEVIALLWGSIGVAHMETCGIPSVHVWLSLGSPCSMKGLAENCQEEGKISSKMHVSHVSKSAGFSGHMGPVSIQSARKYPDPFLS